MRLRTADVGGGSMSGRSASGRLGPSHVTCHDLKKVEGMMTPSEY